MTFDEIWAAVETGAGLRVSNGLPPPSANKLGIAYRSWASHNFNGTLRDKIERDGWRYLSIEVDPSTTGDEVEYLAHEIAEGPQHSFDPLP